MQCSLCALQNDYRKSGQTLELNSIKRLIIAEKPSLARAIAEALPAHKKMRTPLFIVAGDDVVCWAAGHIVVPLQPDEYGAQYRSWENTQLPIVPSEWKVKPNRLTNDLLENIGALLRKAECVVHAGDADREGQLLIDEILSYFSYRGSVSRLLVTDMNTDAIRKALDSMKSNDVYKNVFTSALCRQRADWLFGNNLTRLYSITTNRAWGEKITVGRVQTPTLALVVRRDLDIENFAKHPFYDVKAELEVNGEKFLASWKPSEEQRGLDEKGRVTDQSVIEELKAKLIGKNGVILKADKKRTQSQPPMPHSLPTLQIEASKQYGISPAQTLEIVQAMYESKLVTYPRSDCQYLPESLYEDREKTLACISKMLPELAEQVGESDKSIKTKAWNSEKVEEHHAIVPTGTSGALSDDAAQIYDLIARRYLSQFFPPQEHNEVLIEAVVEGELFRVTSKRCVVLGWKSLYKNTKEEKNDEDDGDSVRAKLPDTKEGESVSVCEITASEKKTSPPEKFTEATLIEAMNNIHRFVEDPQIKATLKETSGIGTAATQANIIELLKDREYIKLSRKRIVSTEKGRSLIASVGDELSKPDTTAIWEMQLKEIEHGNEDADSFIAALIDMVRLIVNKRMREHPIYIIRKDAAQNESRYKCPVDGCAGRMFLHEGRFGKYWKCHTCGLSLSDEEGHIPKISACPACGFIAARIKGRNGYFWGCRNQSCKKTFRDENGELKK